MTNRRMIRSRLWRTLLFLTVLLPSAVGCSDLVKQPYPAKEYFGLEATILDAPEARPRSSSTQPSNTHLMTIRSIRVAPPCDGLAFIYQDSATRFSPDYYSNWIAKPSALLTTGLQHWLDVSGPMTVVPTGSSARADWVVDCDVSRLLIDRTEPGHSRGVISMHVFLIHQLSSETIVVADPIYEEQSTAAADTSAAYSEALGRAYRQVLVKLTSDLRAALAREAEPVTGRRTE